MYSSDQNEQLVQLTTSWRSEAESLRRWPGNEGAVTALLYAADGLEATLSGAANQILALERAAQESGYSVDHLARLVRTGRIPNAGRKHAPRIRRGDLPRKPPNGPVAHGFGGAQNMNRLFRDIVNSKFGG